MRTTRGGGLILNARRAYFWLVGCLVLTGWWTATPYRGLHHDAVFYAAEALRRAGLADLSADPFFAYGSQGDFSAYVSLYAWLISKLGLANAALVSTTVCRCFWLIALFALCRALVSGPQKCLAFALVLALTPYYEPFGIFSYGESFATPRAWAEASVLSSIALAYAGHARVAFIAVAVGLALHPLMAAPGFVLLTLWLVDERCPRISRGNLFAPLLCVALGIAAITALSILGVSPFDRATKSYDAQWWDIVVERNAVAVFQAWALDDACKPAAWLMILLSAWLRLPQGSKGRKLAVATGFTAISCLLPWMVGSAIQNVFLVQIQPWRVMWLVQIIAPVLWAVGWFQRGSKNLTWSDWAELALAFAAMISTNWSSVLLAGIACLLQRGGLSALDSRVQRAVAGGACLALGLVALPRLLAALDLADATVLATRAIHDGINIWASEPAVWFTIAGLLWILLRQASIGRGALIAFYVSGAALALIAFALWVVVANQRAVDDGESEWMTKIREKIPAHATVYWAQPVSVTWLQLRRAHYASNIQGASVLFSRPEAIELQRRLNRLRAIGLTSGTPVWSGGPGKSGVHLDRNRALYLCKDSALDYVVVPGFWSDANSVEIGEKNHSISVFECNATRQLDLKPIL